MKPHFDHSWHHLPFLAWKSWLEDKSFQDACSILEGKWSFNGPNFEGLNCICHAPIRRSTHGNRCMFLNGSQFPGTQSKTLKTSWYHNPFEKREPQPNLTDMISKNSYSRKSIENSTEFHLKIVPKPLSKEYSL